MHNISISNEVYRLLRQRRDDLGMKHYNSTIKHLLSCEGTMDIMSKGTLARLIVIEEEYQIPSHDECVNKIIDELYERAESV